MEALWFPISVDYRISTDTPVDYNVAQNATLLRNGNLFNMSKACIFRLAQSNIATNGHFCFAGSMFLLLATAINEILRAQTRVAACLEYAAHLERPGHFPGLRS